MRDFLTPVTVTDPRPGPDQPDELRYLRAYLLMRAFIGGLAISLPFALVLFDEFLFSKKPNYARDSLSSYFYSGSRDLFVGGLSATAVFLITYKVVERNLDNTLSIVAGAGAMLVALFSTGRPSRTFALTPLQDRLGETFVQAIHYAAAGVFISSLGFICVTFGIREGKRPRRSKQHRSPMFWKTYHLACAGIIGFAGIFIIICGAIGRPKNSLLIGEVMSVWAFGASWLMKGLELEVLRKPKV